MPKSRQPREIWQETRRRVWERDGGLCQYPYGKHPVPLEEVHIDQIHSGKYGTNRMENLRTLCRYLHVLRLDKRHRGMNGKPWKMASSRSTGGICCGKTSLEPAGLPATRRILAKDMRDELGYHQKRAAT